MKLLIVTQELDLHSPTLGFFTAWVELLAERFETIHVICLKEGEHHLPANVHVHSLGKERGEKSAIQYALTFFALAWRLRDRYETIFVHMNQEYLLIAGWLWKMLGKRMYLWRNHYAGSFLTDIAAFWCTHVFCTSKHSYTAKYRRTILMPVGVDLTRFHEVAEDVHEPRSILFLARMAPSKRPDLVIDALALLAGKGGIPFTATFVGSPLPEHEEYYAALQDQVRILELDGQVTFLPGVSHAETAALYAQHDIFVNASRSGMFDKTLFEAAASGCLVLAASDDFKDAAGDRFYFTDAAELADRLDQMLTLSADERVRATIGLRSLARAESLATLADRLALELQV